MKPSKFNIVQSYNEKILLYNTFTTALVELENDIYESIFFNGKHYEGVTEQLVEMGFLVEDTCDELLEQQMLRKAVIENSEEKFANIIIAPTLECNAHCFYCFENGHRKGKMSAETADRLVDYLEAHWNGKRLGITWFGGEPLIAADIIQQISIKLHEKKMVFVSKVITNGSLITNEIVEKMKKVWNTDKVQITIDAIGDEYNYIKKYDDIPDAFEKVMNNLKLILEADFNVRVRINFDPVKKEKALEAMQYLNNRFEQYDNLKVYFAPIDEDEKVVKSITSTFDECSEHPYISLIKFGRQHGLYRGFPDMEDEESEEFDEYSLLKKLKIYPSPTNCYASCPNVYSIDCNGKIYKCHRTLGRAEYASGDIFEGIVKNDVYNFFCDTQVMYEECNECSILPICQGGCKINAKLYSGKEACAPSKAIIKELILLYKEDLDMTGGENDESY